MGHQGYNHKLAGKILFHGAYILVRETEKTSEQKKNVFINVRWHVESEGPVGYLLICG